MKVFDPYKHLTYSRFLRIWHEIGELANDTINDAIVLNEWANLSRLNRAHRYVELTKIRSKLRTAI